MAENFSRSFFNKLQRMGLGPQVTEIIGPHLNLMRITPESRREWHQKMAEHRASEAAKLEADRRQQQRIEAGKKSVAIAVTIAFVAVAVTVPVIDAPLARGDWLRSAASIKPARASGRAAMRRVREVTRRRTPSPPRSRIQSR